MTEASLGAQGRELYSEVWEHKPPGVIGIYAAAVSVFGNGYRAIQITHTLAGLLTALLLWRLGRKAGLDGVAATAAGVFYLIFYGGPLFGGFWATAQVEIFVDPLVALALFCIVPKRDQSRCFSSPLVCRGNADWYRGGLAQILMLSTSGDRIAGFSGARKTSSLQRISKHVGLRFGSAGSGCCDLGVLCLDG